MWARYSVLAGLCLVLCVQAPAYAASAATQSDEGSVFVATASKRNQRLADAPAQVVVVLGRDIEARGYRNLRDLLQDIAGVEIQHKSSSEYQDYYTLRGLSGNEKFIVLHDGFRVSSPTGSPHPMGHNFPLVNVDRVEIMFGAGSALYGPDAFSAVINIITKRGDAVAGLLLDGSYGLLEETDLTLVYGKDYGGLSMVGTATWYQDAGFDFVSDNAYAQESAWYRDHYSADGTMGASLSDPLLVVGTGDPLSFASLSRAYQLSYRVNVDGYELGWVRNVEVHSSALGMDPRVAIYADDATSEMMLDSLYLTHFYDSGEQGWTIRWILGYGTYELKPGSTTRDVSSGYDPVHVYAWGQRTHFEEHIDWRLTDWFLASIGGATDVISAIPRRVGLSAPYEPSISGVEQTHSYLGTDVELSSGESLAIEQDTHTLNDQNMGLYGQGHIDLVEWAELTAGVRYDQSTRYGSSISSRAALVSEPLEGMELKLIYGEAFSSPSPYQAYRHFGTFQSAVDAGASEPVLEGGSWHLPNPGLKSEKVRTGEASLAYRFGGATRLALSGYYSNLSGLVRVEAEGPGTFQGVGVENILRAQNAADGFVLGAIVELESKVVIQGMSLKPYGSYSFVDGEVGGQVVGYAAKHSLKLGLDLKAGSFSVSARARYRSESFNPLRTNEEGEFISAPASVSTSVYGRYQITSGSMPFSAWVSVENALNHRSWHLGYGGSETLGRVPQDPLRARVGVSLGVPGL